MHPDLITLGPLKIHSFGFLLALSFLLGLFLVQKRGVKAGYEKEIFLDLFQVILISSVLGARGFFVLSHLDSFADRPLSVFYLWEGGMTLYGGILLAIAASAWFLKKKGQDFLSLADILAPGLALGIFITRVGCFLNGCCYGLPTDCSIGVHFPEHSAASHSAREFLSGPSGSLEGIPLSPAVHPSQLYASFGGLLIFLALLWLPLRVRGLVFASFLLLYGIHRSIVDLFRFYDASGQGALGFTLSQWISLGLVLWSILLFYRILKGRSSGK